MKLTNTEIYSIANGLGPIANNGVMKLPIKVNFFLQKNMKLLAAAAQEIEEARLEVAKKYSTSNGEEGYYIPPENMTLAQQDINTLFSIEQELDIKTVKIDDFGAVEFTPAQMQIIMFMINEE